MKGRKTDRKEEKQRMKRKERWVERFIFKDTVTGLICKLMVGMR